MLLRMKSDGFDEAEITASIAAENAGGFSCIKQQDRPAVGAVLTCLHLHCMVNSHLILLIVVSGFERNNKLNTT